MPETLGLGRTPFLWHCFDLRPELPKRWREDGIAVAERFAAERSLVPTSVTSREDAQVSSIPVLTVGGRRVTEHLPWLYSLYQTRLRDLAQHFSSETVVCATDIRYGVTLNVQRGRAMRYEAHVDSNPIEGLLYFTTHPPGRGGDLRVSNVGDVAGLTEIDADMACIYPVAGHVVYFDARHHSHYVTGLVDDGDMRVVAAMNFYTPASPESSRPTDLNKHLFGEQ
jgi:hypothetical protein